MARIGRGSNTWSAGDQVLVVRAIDDDDDSDKRPNNDYLDLLPMARIGRSETMIPMARIGKRSNNMADVEDRSYHIPMPRIG